MVEHRMERSIANEVWKEHYKTLETPLAKYRRMWMTYRLSHIWRMKKRDKKHASKYFSNKAEEDLLSTNTA